MECFSAPGGRVEHDRGVSGQRPEHVGARHRAERVPAGDHRLVHLLPAQQASAHHLPDQRPAEHQPAAQLPAGRTRQVFTWLRFSLIESVRPPTSTMSAVLGY